MRNVGVIVGTARGQILKPELRGSYLDDLIGLGSWDSWLLGGWGSRVLSIVEKAWSTCYLILGKVGTSDASMIPGSQADQGDDPLFCGC